MIYTLLCVTVADRQGVELNFSLRSSSSFRLFEAFGGRAEHGGVSFFHAFGAFYFYFASEAEYPAEKDVAYRNIYSRNERAFVVLISRYVFAEAVDNRIHDIVIANKLHFLVLAVEHMKSGVDIFVNVEAVGRRSALVFKNCRAFRDSVHTEAAEMLFVFVNAYHVIAVAVPDKMKRRDNIRLSVTLQNPFLLGVVSKVLKGNLPVHVNRFIYGVDDDVNFFVFGLYSSLTADISFQSLRNMAACKGADFVNERNTFPAVMNFEDSTASISSFSSGISKRRP